MKKWTYLLSGIIIGALVATTGSAFAAEITSLIGQKVTGEYIVVVNGKKLAEKGAVVDGRTNVPARSISEALGADVSVSENVINITSKSNSSNVVVNGDNPYMGRSKTSLEKSKEIFEVHQLGRAIEGKKSVLRQYESFKEMKERFGSDERDGYREEDEEIYKKRLAEYEADIEKFSKELEQINEALAAINE